MKQNSLLPLTLTFLVLCLHEAQCGVQENIKTGDNPNRPTGKFLPWELPFLSLSIRFSSLVLGGSESGSVQIKPGTCPRIRIPCKSLSITVRCRTDSSCNRNQKCCFYNCQKMCMDNPSHILKTPRPHQD
ncbi:eppin-like [Sorex araneus]|uniref:eppin-like n=1 Tax=Sorex araneus TaxID=42254 RepID=UPI0024336AE2|nr:eppin-like [Sorex araneus]